MGFVWLSAQEALWVSRFRPACVGASAGAARVPGEGRRCRSGTERRAIGSVPNMLRGRTRRHRAPPLGDALKLISAASGSNLADWPSRP